MNDIKTNPGPAVVDNNDTSKTICAPYSRPCTVFNLEKNLSKSTGNHKANKKPAVFKSLNQRVNYYKILLSTDIERNPGPGIVDPTKTIRKNFCITPYIYYACRLINYVCALLFQKTIGTPEGIEYIH